MADQIENQLLEENIHVSIGIAVSGTGSIESETGSEIVSGTNERTKSLDDAVKEADEKMYLVKQKRHHR